ncbi:uncharacterized protein L201_004982 [Kwoniella dendrophila CBS 6074]|uniref:Chromo domain-containing protein n=1 Tax=Kwoniella dendrophila CBS 6074 TaxID=1295534 RepID=A0AAX4JZN6_9TREE
MSSLLPFFSTSPTVSTSTLPTSPNTLKATRRQSIPTPSTGEMNGQLPTPLPSSTYSHSRDMESEAGPSTLFPSSSQPLPSNSHYINDTPSIPSTYRSSRENKTPTPQPTSSITKELFRISNLVMKLDNDRVQSVKENDRRLDAIEETIDRRLNSIGDILSGFVDKERSSRIDLKGLVEGLNVRLETLERVCRSISRSQSALEYPTLNGNGSGNYTTHIDGFHNDTLDINSIDNNNADYLDTQNQLPYLERGINPQDIMQPPIQTSSGMRKKVAAVITRSHDNNDSNEEGYGMDDLNEAGYGEAPKSTSKHATRSKRTIEIQPERTPSSSSTDVHDFEENQENEEESINTSPQTARKSPFPSQPPASISSTQSKKRGRPKGSKNRVKPASVSDQFKISEDNQAQDNSDDVDVDLDDRPERAETESSFEPEEESPKKRKKGNATRRGRKSLKSELETEQKMEREKAKYDRTKYTQNGTVRIRKFKGQVRLAVKCLGPSDGRAVTEATWPNKGPNTAKGRLEEIVCDICKGRCHWSCAGLPEDKDMTQETWMCPDCEYKTTVEEIPAILIDVVQQLKCIRYNCILREKRALEAEEGAEERYFVEKVVGRRAIARDPETKKRIFQYLVKWDGYELDECTWEPLANLEHQSERLLSKYEEAAKRTRSNLKMRVCILPEARKCWDENTGDQIFNEKKGKFDEGSDETEEDGEDQTDDQDVIEHKNIQELPEQPSFEDIDQIPDVTMDVQESSEQENSTSITEETEESVNMESGNQVETAGDDEVTPSEDLQEGAITDKSNNTNTEFEEHDENDIFNAQERNQCSEDDQNLDELEDEEEQLKAEVDEDDAVAVARASDSSIDDNIESGGGSSTEKQSTQNQVTEEATDVTKEADTQQNKNSHPTELLNEPPKEKKSLFHIRLF